ncbi:MAG: hypothetical protein QM589_16825 [Thermomicrobiales bacterium]
MPTLLASPANRPLPRTADRVLPALDPVRPVSVPRLPHPSRSDTPQRWQKALERAQRAGLQLRQLMGSGAWIVTSERDDEAAYMVTEFDCECFAAEFGDPVCKHRAMLRHRLGHLRDMRARLPEAA